MNKIGWTEKTWNPIIGCNKISEGCKRCYAEKMALRLARIESTRHYYQMVVKDNPKGWNGNTVFAESQLSKPFKRKKPTMYFVVSMGDLFHESVPFEWIDQVFSTIMSCEHHIFQILTKRPDRMLAYYQSRDYVSLPNVWLGTTVESQKHVNRIKILSKIPAKVRFVSVEPMLSVINLRTYYFNSTKSGEYPFRHLSEKHRTKLIDLVDWVICGGESGPNASPMHPDWVDNLLDQCKAAKVPFYFKQWGEWIATDEHIVKYDNECILKPDGSLVEMTSDPDAKVMRRVGKKAAGSLIYDMEYKEFPNIK